MGRTLLRLAVAVLMAALMAVTASVALAVPQQVPDATAVNLCHLTGERIGNFGNIEDNLIGAIGESKRGDSAPVQGIEGAQLKQIENAPKVCS